MLHVLPDCDAEARAANVPPILLPHAGEMASLLGCDKDEVEADPLAAGRRCAERYGALVLVKGVQSHVVAPDGARGYMRGGGPGPRRLGQRRHRSPGSSAACSPAAPTRSPPCCGACGSTAKPAARLAKKVGPLGFLAREIPAEVPALLLPTR